MTLPNPPSKSRNKKIAPYWSSSLSPCNDKDLVKDRSLRNTKETTPVLLFEQDQEQADQVNMMFGTKQSSLTLLLRTFLSFVVDCITKCVSCLVHKSKARRPCDTDAIQKDNCSTCHCFYSSRIVEVDFEEARNHDEGNEAFATYCDMIVHHDSPHHPEEEDDYVLGNDGGDDDDDVDDARDDSDDDALENRNNDIRFVVRKRMMDHQYDEEAFYTGAMSTTTGMPHGNGCLEFIAKGRLHDDEGHGNQESPQSTMGSCRERVSKEEGHGEVYEGGFKHDQKHGTGVMQFADGRVFEGEYKNGRMMQGKMTYPDGSVHEDAYDDMRPSQAAVQTRRFMYEGEFRDGSFHGCGKMTWSDGGSYSGEWRDGKMHGHGKEMRPRGSLWHRLPIQSSTSVGSIFSAFPLIPSETMRRSEQPTTTVDNAEDTVFVTNKQIKDSYGETGVYTGVLSKSTGMPNGEGRLEYEKEGRWYEGDWIHGRCWTGHGLVSKGDGNIYEGNLKQGYEHGNGIKRFADGRVFEGEYIRGKMVKGKMTYQDGSVYEGTWVNDEQHGHDHGLHADKSEYEGEFRQGNFHGHGQMKWSDGGRYVGEWRDGKMHGRGKETRPDGSLRHDGEWFQGKPIRWSTSTGSLLLAFPAPSATMVRSELDESYTNESVDTLFVTNKQIVDLYGKTAVYTGAVSKSTGMPHGTGHLEYTEKADSNGGHWIPNMTYENGSNSVGWSGDDMQHGQDNEDDGRRPYELEDETYANVSTDTLFVTDKQIVDPYGEKGVYTGALSKSTGMPNGKGRLEYEKEGRWYEGDWIHGRWTGYGRLSNGDGDFYEGGLKNDHKHGIGVTRFADGHVFEGEYIRGQMIQGKMTYQDGSVYGGSWVDGMRHGRGKCIFVDGSEYEGEFREGNFHGHGKMAWNDGGWYLGEWSDGEMHGQGKEVRPDGSLRHDGEWCRGNPIHDGRNSNRNT